jgi:hypothetical protein
MIAGCGRAERGCGAVVLLLLTGPMMVATQLNRSLLFFGPAEQLAGASLARSFHSYAQRDATAREEGDNNSQHHVNMSDAIESRDRAEAWR